MLAPSQNQNNAKRLVTPINLSIRELSNHFLFTAFNVGIGEHNEFAIRSLSNSQPLKHEPSSTTNRPVVDVIKLFGGNLDFPKVKKLNEVCSNV